MTEPKYYTPTLEEFHVGFEFELEIERATSANNIKNIFLPCTFGNNQDGGEAWELLSGYAVHNKDSILAVIRDAVNNDKVRVKYLDREDIESLGWEKYGANFIKPGANLLLHADGSIMILKGDFPVFSGIIKNKSELKRLMKQLQKKY